MENLKITVIVATFNRAPYIEQCLDSLLNQTLKPHQIIVINDGSTDQTPQIYARYKGDIEYYEQKRAGKAAAVNAILPKVNSDYIWIFDDDDVAVPDALERLAGPLEKNKEFDFSYGTCAWRKTQADHTLGETIWTASIPPFPRGLFNALLEENFLGGPCIFARTSCYRAIGGFDVTLLRSQDYDLAIRLSRAYKATQAPGGPIFYYRQHEGIRGMGGVENDFLGLHQKEKWLEYDQIIFKKLYRQLPLAEYAGGFDIKSHARRALLQRMRVMSSKGLLDEMLQDLDLLSVEPALTPYSKEEYTLVREMVFHKPYYNIPCIMENPAVLEKIRRGAKNSREIRFLRSNLTLAIGARCKNKMTTDNVLAGLGLLEKLHINILKNPNSAGVVL